MTTVFFLTVRELRHRRVVAVLLALTLAYAVAVAWGFDRFATLTRPTLAPAQFAVLTSQLVVLVMFMFSFVLGVTAVFVASPAISGDSESGVFLAVLARPIRRGEVLVGKWLASSVALVAYSVVGGALLLGVVLATTGYAPPAPLEFLAFLAAETIIGVTFATLLSTLAPPMAGGAIAVAAFGIAWIAGIASSVGLVLENDALMRVGTISRLLLPTDGLWRGAMFHLEPSVVLLALSGAGARAMAANPFFAMAPPPTAYLVWCAAWVAALLAAALWVFRRREL